MDYKKALEIDLERLEENLKEQAGLVMECGELWAGKTAERDRAKENLSVIEAELDGYARANWVDISTTKMTEKSVLGYVLNNEKQKEAMKEFIKLNEEVNILSVARNAFEHRKKAMEGLVSLHIAEYWADPKIAKRDIDEIKSSERKGEQEEELNKNPRLTKLKKRR